MKRYSQLIRVYTVANSDEEAIENGKRLAKEIDAENDNNAHLTAMYEVPYGSLETREIKL